EGEIYNLIVFMVLGLAMMAAAADLILLFLAIEFVSLISYVLAGALKGDPKSNEAGIKYFFYGAAASAVMLYGFTFLYGAAGTTNIYRLMQHTAYLNSGFLGLAVMLVLAGLGFKISIVPFHQWTPDVYEGAPTPVTAFLSVGSKAQAFNPVGPWSGQGAVLFYLFAYTFTNMGAFAVAISVERALGSDAIPDYAGLSTRAPFSAFAMALFMLSLTGIPPTAVFFGKFFLFA